MTHETSQAKPRQAKPRQAKNNTRQRQHKTRPKKTKQDNKTKDKRGHKKHVIRLEDKARVDRVQYFRLFFGDVVL